MKAKYLLILLIAQSLFVFREVVGQDLNILGDTIFVHTDFQVELKFPSNNSIPRWSPTNAPFKAEITNIGILIRATSEATTPAILLITEGPGQQPRQHRFVVMYKKDLQFDSPETIKDWNTKQKLQQYVKDLTAKALAKRDIFSSPISTPTIVKTTENKSGGYYAILEDGDKALENGQFDLAQTKYEEVLKMQPENKSAKRGLQEVKEKKLEKENLAKKELNDKVTKLQTTGTTAFYAKKYDEAIVAYREALALNPNDLFSKSQINTIEKYKADQALAQKQEEDRLAKKQLEDNLKSIKLRGAKSFEEEKYDEAISAYSEALALNPDDQFSATRIETIRKIKAQKKSADEQAAINRDREQSFKSIMADADKAFDNREYDVAKAGYTAAKDLKPTDAVLERKLKATNDKILLKGKDDEYNAAMALGDEAKKIGDYNKAKAEYAKASALFKERTEPVEKTKEINKIINDLAAEQNNEKAKQARELQRNADYISSVEKADKALEKKDFTNAKILYTQASKLKPEESYPKDKITEIGTQIDMIERDKKARLDSIASLSEGNKKYNAAMAKGNAALQKGDFKNANEAFSVAADLKPNEQEPKDKLELVSQKLFSIEANIKYDTAIAKGNIALTEKNKVAALEFYKEAQRLKPLDSYALNQVKYIQGMLTKDSLDQAETQRIAEAVILEEVYTKRFQEGMKAYANYENAAGLANYEDQLFYLKQFLNIVPDNSLFNKRQYNDDPLIFSKKKIQTIRDYLTRTKGAKYQLEPITYLNQELEAKYENINFTLPPTDQSFDSALMASTQNHTQIHKDVLAEAPRVNVADNGTGTVKLSLLSISFKYDKAFYKFKIDNSDTAEFVTGAMQLTQKTTDGIMVKHQAGYISAFPIVLPGKEFFIVYETGDFTVNPQDVLVFEMNDRLKKMKLELNIPVSVYQQEKTRKN